MENPIIDFLSHRRSVKPDRLAAPGPSASELDTILTIASRVPDHKKLAPWRFVIIEGDAQNYHVVKPNAVLEGICQKGCLIRLDNSEEDPYELKGSEVTSIEEGQLYDDELEAPDVPDVGAGPPSQPSSQP